MIGSTERRSSRLLGLLIGLALAAAGVISWRMPAASGVLGTDLRMLAGPTGELEVTPSGPFLSATNLSPGGAVSEGTVAVRNQTGTPLAVRLRALPSEVDLDPLLMVELTAGGDRIFEGALEGLRAWTGRPFRLMSGERTLLRVRSWLPDTVRAGYQGRIEDVGFEFAVEPLRL